MYTVLVLLSGDNQQRNTSGRLEAGAVWATVQSSLGSLGNEARQRTRQFGSASRSQLAPWQLSSRFQQVS